MAIRTISLNIGISPLVVYLNITKYWDFTTSSVSQYRWASSEHRILTGRLIGKLRMEKAATLTTAVMFSSDNENGALEHSHRNIILQFGVLSTVLIFHWLNFRWARQWQGAQRRRRGAKTPCTPTCRGLFEMENSLNIDPIVISGAKMPCTPTCQGLFKMGSYLNIEREGIPNQLL